MKTTTLATAALTFGLTLSQVASADLIVRVHGSPKTTSTQSSNELADDGEATSNENNGQEGWNDHEEVVQVDLDRSRRAID